MVGASGLPAPSLAADLFEEAIAADSSYALAHASIAVPYYVTPFVSNEMDEAEAKQKARAAAARALELDPNLADAHLADAVMKMVYGPDYEAAEVAFERALELDPEHSEARREYANLLSRSGRMEEALVEAERALVLDPQALRAYGTLCFVQQYTGHLDEAIETAQRALEHQPYDAEHHDFIAAIHNARGEYDEALAAAEKGLESNAGHSNLNWQRAWALANQGSLDEALAGFELNDGNLGGAVWVRALMGNSDEAGDGIEALKVRMEQGQWWQAWNIATTYQALGQKEEALSWYEQAYESRINRADALRQFGWWLANGAYYASIRDEPRIQAIIEKSGV